MAHAATNEAIIITNAFVVLREGYRNDGREGGREGGREQVRVEARERAIEHGRQELGTAKLGNMILRLATQGPGYSGNRGQPHPPPGSQASRCCATASSRVSQNLQFTMEKALFSRNTKTLCTKNPLKPQKELPHAMADGDDIKRANEDLSRLLRSSVFPGAVSGFPKRSVTHQMLSEADPANPEFK